MELLQKQILNYLLIISVVIILLNDIVFNEIP
jgi:hypothetical protein